LSTKIRGNRKLIPAQKASVAFCHPTIEYECGHSLHTIADFRNVLTVLRRETGVFAPESKFTFETRIKGSGTIDTRRHFPTTARSAESAADK